MCDDEVDVTMMKKHEKSVIFEVNFGGQKNVKKRQKMGFPASLRTA